MICDTRVVYGKRIKVVPKYQAMAAYPPIPPVPPAPPVSPYGRPSGGNGPSAYGPSEKEKDGNPVKVFGKMSENDRTESEKGEL